MRQALKATGVESFAFRLNRLDLTRAPLPAIFLRFDHYYILERVDADAAQVYDPGRHQRTKIALPPLDDRGFLADLILFSPPALADNS